MALGKGGTVKPIPTKYRFLIAVAVGRAFAALICLISTRVHLCPDKSYFPQIPGLPKSKYRACSVPGEVWVLAEEWNGKAYILAESLGWEMLHQLSWENPWVANPDKD